ncbi:MAG: type 4a pilus biogenesis protein PilO [Proteobacteria bacterium]|nr:type 4a pilus biogenesis protein PilO [Pseudomonadota bacterium]
MFDEIIFRYKNLSMPLRILLCVVLGMLPKVISYYEEIVVLEADLENANLRESSERSKLADIKEKTKNIPQIEATLTSTREQLMKAETRLPNDIKVDEVLKQVGTAANAFNLRLINFAPKGVELIPGEYSYDELKYQVILNGKFSDLALWMDRMIQKDSRAYIKHWKIAKNAGSTERVNLMDGSLPSSSNDSQIKEGRPPLISSGKIPENAISAEQSSNEVFENKKMEMEKIRSDFKLNLMVGLSYFRVSSGTANTQEFRDLKEEKSPIDKKEETKKDGAIGESNSTLGDSSTSSESLEPPTEIK